MRTIEKVATGFSIAALALGVTGFIAPLVSGSRDKVFNTHTSKQFGFAATNWQHSLTHVIPGAVGLIPAVRKEHARTYVSVMTGLLAAAAALGWATTRNRPGIHYTMGMAVNRADNIVNTIWAALGALFALQPDFSFRLPSGQQVKQTADRVRNRFEEKVEQKMPEKMPY